MTAPGGHSRYPPCPTANPVSPTGTKEAIRPISASKRQLATAVADKWVCPSQISKLRENSAASVGSRPSTGLFNRRSCRSRLNASYAAALAPAGRSAGFCLISIISSNSTIPTATRPGHRPYASWAAFLHHKFEAEESPAVSAAKSSCCLPDTSLECHAAASREVAGSKQAGKHPIRRAAARSAYAFNGRR